MAASKTKRWARVSSMPNGQYAQYIRACPMASGIACSKTAKDSGCRIRHSTGKSGMHRHTGILVLARQRNAFSLVEGQLVAMQSHL